MFFMDYFNAATTLLSTIFYPIIPSIGNSGTSFVMGLEVVDISPSGTDASPASHILASSAVFCMPSGSFYIDESDTFKATLKFSEPGYIPVTVVKVNSDLSPSSIRETVEHFRNVDDVWDAHFLESVFFIGAQGHTGRLSAEMTEYLLSLGTKRIAFLDDSTPSLSDIPLGPYFASSSGLYKTWKLLPDTHGAFVAAVVQTSSQQIKYMNATTAEASPNMAIAIPSRLYFYPPTPARPLEGLRVGVKDNIDISGVKTFASSSAYGQLYGVSVQSAPVIERLVHLGAVIVGKTSMSQFADAEDPPVDFVEFHAPQNPRGDGNRSPGGSSFGAGAAAGAYDWLDFTIGTDTGGSVRQPAASQAIYGMRPSRDVLSIEGTVLISRDLDAIGVLSKDFDVLSRVSSQLFQLQPHTGPSDEAAPAHTKLIYPSHLFPVDDELAQEVYDKVIVALEKITRSKRVVINFRNEWKRAQNFTEEEYEEYFKEVFNDYVAWGQFTERAAFRDEYEEKFGRPPYVNPVAQLRWRTAANFEEGHFENIRAKRRQFEAFISNLFGEDSIMVTPFKFGEPESRDTYRLQPSERDPAEFGWGLRPAFQSPMAGQPEIVFPVGQLPVLSETSKREENYGVIASLIGPQGSDLALLELTSRVLEELGIPKQVMTGRVPFNNDSLLNPSD